jgi:hypothetical protein
MGQSADELDEDGADGAWMNVIVRTSNVLMEDCLGGR